jgi:sugar phosphate isomerase/epimerase
MRLGLSSYTYTWAVGVPGYPVAVPLTAMGLLDRAAALGVPVVQIADNLPLDTLDAAALDTLANEAAVHHIQIEPGTRGIAPDHLVCYLRLAQQFASSVVRVVIDTAVHQPGLDEAIELLKESMPAYEAAGVTLAIENHDRFNTEAFLHILETVDSPCLGICLDTVNSFGALEGPDVVIEALGSRTINLHVKDFSVRRADHKMGFVVEGTPAGQGRLDIPALLARLRAWGFDGSAILELWTPPEATLEATLSKEAAWAEKSIKYLQRITNYES